MRVPEPATPTEVLDLEQKVEDTLSGKRPLDNTSYPYFAPDYEIPFVHIGIEKQLFLDNWVLDHLEGVVRVFPKPQRRETPVLEANDLPWETRHHPIPAAAMYDAGDGVFKMWYCEAVTDSPFTRGRILCYAESKDGLRWEKPLSERCLPCGGHRATNIVQEDASHVTVVLNHDQSDPDRKYLMVYNPQCKADDLGLPFMTTTAASPDGLRWTTISKDTPYRLHHRPRIIWDEAIQKWIAYTQYSHHRNYLHRKRQIGRQESADFVNWSPKEVVLSVDWDPNLPPNLEHHEMSVRKVGGLYIGIATEFLGEPLWCSGKQGQNWHDTAYARLGLYVSRDGKRWQRVNGSEPWADNGRPGSIDYGFLNFTVADQLYHEGKMYIHYAARPEKQHWYGRFQWQTPIPDTARERGLAHWQDLHDALGRYPRRERSIGVLILREDGWAELKPAYERGKVVTRQFVFEGNTLRINADAYGGYVRVEVLRPDFEPYPGFSARECDPVFSDEPQDVWHRVSWRGDPDVCALWNKPVRLVFHLHQASLYAFQFPREWPS